MATKKQKSAPPAPKKGASGEANSSGTLTTGNNPLATIDDGLSPRLHRPSDELIYEAIMRSGGEPFGHPFEVGLGTLTERVVKYFKQLGFFGFETFEAVRPKRRRNRFTRHGSSRYFGDYDVLKAKRAAVEILARADALERHLERKKKK